MLSRFSSFDSMQRAHASLLTIFAGNKILFLDTLISSNHCVMSCIFFSLSFLPYLISLRCFSFLFLRFLFIFSVADAFVIFPS
ncbi:hypothetical protein BDW59DRAFT_108679 [Aspergillus cavernicola]|uniref:Uncharacterized protein n=1 Tax=Aspergillus cavernicola TaxID=176166 RepID=A0ABR4I1U3_9EURO